MWGLMAPFTVQLLSLRRSISRQEHRRSTVPTSSSRSELNAGSTPPSPVYGRAALKGHPYAQGIACRVGLGVA